MDNSQLGRLPAELRNHIYELCLTLSATISIDSCEGAKNGIYNHMFFDSSQEWEVDGKTHSEPIPPHIFSLAGQYPLCKP